METDFDLLLSASCYKSAPSAVRMIDSVKHIDGRVLTIITSPRLEDLNYIQAHCDKNPYLMLFLSKFDNMYLCRNWGFIYAYMNDMFAPFYGSCDDDIEFTRSSYDILPRLARERYSIMTFNNSANHYAGWKGIQHIGSCVILPWMNGDSMFSRWQMNIIGGLPDCLNYRDPMPICTESEYQQRLFIFSGEMPLLSDEEHPFYIHHFRDTNDKIMLRDVRINERIDSGIEFFRQKYPNIFPLGNIDINHFDVHTALRKHIRSYPEQARAHLLYGGAWNIVGIHHKINREYTQVWPLT